MDDPLKKVLGRTADALEKGLGLRTVEDLLRHYPRRYAERGQLTDLRMLEVDEHVTVLARVSRVDVKQYRDKRTGRMVDRLEVVVGDGASTLQLTFFKQSWRTKDLRVGRVGLFSGKVGKFRSDLQLAHPDYVLLPDDSDVAPADEVEDDTVLRYAGALIPVYPATAAMPSWKIATSVGVVLDQLPADLDDPLPEATRTRHSLPPLAGAIRKIHVPTTREEIREAVERLTWDEAFVLQAVLAQRRYAAAALPATPRTPVAGGLLEAFDARLPFTLTAGQVEVGATIADDLARTHPMHRLLQGEVGSGKTLVALRAMLTVVDSGGQAVLLAPTEVLAQQHQRSIIAMLGPLAERGLLGGGDVGTRVALLTGSVTAARRREAMLDIQSGEAGIVIGTHALLEEKVQFFDLGLVVVDEQHRFGVEQRAALAAKARDDQRPHVLVMTATPIPRTVAMTTFGDLETSVLTELPAGRSPITTHVVPTSEKPGYLDRAWERIREEVSAGRQAYVVFPRIGGDGAAGEDVDEPADPAAEEKRRPPLAVLDLVDHLTAGPLAGLRVGVLHGRMPSDEKDDVMRRFGAGPSSPDGIDVLLATTVVEVGVDVPNATVMVVMDADRFGVSQLHQLRGRIGRGAHAGLCLLVTEMHPASPARGRLDAVAATSDGFELSRIDLEARREGDVLGASQSGRRSSLRLLSVLRDEDVIVAAREEAGELVARDPELTTVPALGRAIAALLDEDRADYLEKS
ncbi:ATP-dependent DNA helicase RecG [Longivirga aurantiaca]|uniref:Probable DNA 3'-5' helicase RecG n=1 Tax=Longivirga aurantiaca TaxID=1837743 RepID=A0ABW1SZJ3_9ACTN